MLTVLTTIVISGILIGSLYVLYALGLSLLWTTTDVVNVAYAWFLLTAAYLTFSFVGGMGYNLYLAVPIVILIFLVLTPLLYVGVFKPVEDKTMLNAIIYTLGAGLLIEGILHHHYSSEPHLIPSGLGSITILGESYPMVDALAFVLMVIAIVIVSIVIHYTYFGMVMRGMSVNKTATQLMGADIRRVQFIVFAVSVLIAIFAGVFLGLKQSFVPTTAIDPLVVAFIVTILAGIGSIRGLVVGGALLGIAEQLASTFLPVWTGEVVGLIIFFVVLIALPEGLFGEGGALK